MVKVLTVDDSRAVRMIVAKHTRELGFEVEEAEDGEQGLVKLGQGIFDLVILDVTMPVLDGPGMLARMRELGNRTPVLMLTSESKRSIVAQLMKLGIKDYILKPFKPEELRAKVLKALNMEAPPAVPGAVVEAAQAQGSSGEISSPPSDAVGRPAGDVLVVDDMETVAKRLRLLLPARYNLGTALNAQAALDAARERSYRVLLIDYDLPDLTSLALTRQLRLLQPQAVFLALALRTTSNVQDEAKKGGFDGVVYKPFTSEALEEFLRAYLDDKCPVSRDKNLLKVGAFRGHEPRLPGYFAEVSSALCHAADEIAAAAFSAMIVDIGQVPPVAEKVARLVVDMNEHAQRAGVALRLVASPEVLKVLRQRSETAGIPAFSSMAEAQKAA